MYNIVMLNWLKGKSWEDWTVYGFLLFTGLGILIFLVGFLFGFQINIQKTPLFPDHVNGSISGVLFGKETKPINAWLINDGIIHHWNFDRTTLFTLYKSIPSTEQFASFKSMAACSIAGFSLIIIAIFLFVTFAGFVLVKEIILPWILKKIKSNN